MNRSGRFANLILFILGLLIMVYVALMVAPHIGNGLMEFIVNIDRVFIEPFNIKIVPESRQCIVIFVGLYIAAGIVLYTSKQGFRVGEEYGSAEYANTSTLSRKYRQLPLYKNIILTAGFCIGLNSYKHKRNLNVFVVGGAGAGKSRGYVMPNIMNCNTSFIVTDPKGEVLRSTGTLLKNKVYKVRVLNLYEPWLSDGYNPFVYIRNDDDVLRLVSNFWKATTEKGAQKGEQFWDDSAREFLQALIFFLHYEAPAYEQNFDMIMYLIREATIDEAEEEENPVDVLFQQLEDKEPNHIAVKYYKSYKKGAGKTLKSIQKMLTSRLEKFNLPSVANMTRTALDELDLYRIGIEKTALFLVMPVADKSLNFLISMLYTQLFEILYNYGNKHGGSLGIPVHFLIDEAANISLPLDFPERLSTGRGYKINFSIVLQGINQWKALYKDDWESMIGNCDLFLYLGNNEQSTHSYISKLIGKQTIKLNTYGETKGRSGSYSKNTQQTGRDLLTPDEVRQMDNDYALLFVKGERPIMDKKYNLMAHPNIKATPHAGANPYNHTQLTYSAGMIELVDPLDYPNAKIIQIK